MLHTGRYRRQAEQAMLTTGIAGEETCDLVGREFGGSCVQGHVWQVAVPEERVSSSRSYTRKTFNLLASSEHPDVWSRESRSSLQIRINLLFDTCMCLVEPDSSTSLTHPLLARVQWALGTSTGVPFQAQISGLIRGRTFLE